jgi:hypothetical protein
MFFLKLRFEIVEFTLVFVNGTTQFLLATIIIQFEECWTTENKFVMMGYERDIATFNCWGQVSGLFTTGAVKVNV